MRIYLCPRKIYAVSVIIPLYNAEKYIGECLDSLLIQTLQNFEVIVVDDCSTDKSVAIVESYAPKFNGRLKLTTTEKNSGGGGYIPRNIGLKLASGEYIQFLDADDFLLGSALETLYNSAKEYDADVVYTASYYRLIKPNEVYPYWDELNKKLLKENKTDTPNLIVDNPNENLKRLFLGKKEGNFHACWSKFFRREFLIKNEIVFPIIPNAGDFIFVINVYCRAKRFLRLPTPLYFYRLYNIASITHAVKSSSEHISHWFLSFIDFVKNLHELENKEEFLSHNPAYCFVAFKKHFEFFLTRIDKALKPLSTQEIYEILYNAFAKDYSDYTAVLSSFLFSFIDSEKKIAECYKETINKFKNYFTARIDVKLIPKGNGDFQILFVSDDKITIKRAGFLAKNEIGYLFPSYDGKLELVAKATVDGQINLSLRGLDIRDPEDKSKRIPYWIDYTKFVVNDQIIFDTLTPAWHDKPFRYNLDVKADEEIKVEVEWLPHRVDTIDVSANVKEIQEKSADKDTLINKLQVTLDNEKKAADKQKVLIAELQAALDTEKKIHSDDAELIRKFSDYFTSRIDLRLVPNSKGKLQIVSVSDEKATIKKAGWLPKNESGYFIQSYVGKMELVAKATADGQINLDLRGLDVRNPEDRSKKIPYWIDYTKLTVNGEVLFDELTPVWHNKPFRYKLDVKASEEIKIQVEWQPHRSDT